MVLLVIVLAIAAGWAFSKSAAANRRAYELQRQIDQIQLDCRFQTQNEYVNSVQDGLARSIAELQREFDTLRNRLP